MANLVTRVNGELIEKDAPVVSFRGETWKFLRATRAPGEGYAAKVEVEHRRGGRAEFYASVFPGLEVVDEDAAEILTETLIRESRAELAGGTVSTYRVHNVPRQLDMAGEWDTEDGAWRFIKRNGLPLDEYRVRLVVELRNPELSE